MCLRIMPSLQRSLHLMHPTLSLTLTLCLCCILNSFNLFFSRYVYMSIYFFFHVLIIYGFLNAFPSSIVFNYQYTITHFFFFFIYWKFFIFLVFTTFNYQCFTLALSINSPFLAICGLVPSFSTLVALKCKKLRAVLGTGLAAPKVKGKPTLSILKGYALLVVDLP